MCEAHKEFSHLHGYMALSFTWQSVGSWVPNSPFTHLSSDKTLSLLSRVSCERW